MFYGIVLIIGFLLFSIVVITLNFIFKKDLIDSKEKSNSVLSSPTVDSTDQYYKKYENSSIKLVSWIPYIEDEIKLYPYFILSDSSKPPHSIVVVQIDSTDSLNSKELYEKFYTSTTPQGQFIDSTMLNINNLEISMGLIDVPMGKGAYLLIGAIKNGNTGFYFQEFIGEKDHNITAKEISEIFEHKYIDVQQYFLSVIFDLYNNNLKQTDFSKLKTVNLDSNRDMLRKINNNLFPTTF